MELGENACTPAAASPCGDEDKELPVYHMFLDADRDGAADFDWQGAAPWVWGAGGQGAIMLCNNDDDGVRSAPDNKDDQVNGGNDGDELAPIVFRRLGPSPPSSWKGVIEVSAEDARRVRIFNIRYGSGKEVIGPTAGARYPLPSLDFQELEYGIEALRYAGTRFDGTVAIQFTIEDGSSTLGGNRGIFRVAPWMMPSHLDAAEKVFVVDAGSGNARFRTELAGFVSAAGCALVQHPSPDDIWMQDCMEIGHHFGAKLKNPVVVRSPRNRPLQSFPKSLLKPDFGYEEATPMPSAQSTFDSTGNLEVTPPCTTKDGRHYPWGRIYYGPGRRGERMDRGTIEFLKQQVVQAPFQVATEWLLVGHVDEIITFVPGPGSQGFKLLLASPSRAYEILDANRKAHGAEKMLIGRSFSAGPAEVSIDDYLARGIAGLRLTASQLRHFNDAKTKQLIKTRKLLMRMTGVVESDIIDVPILYMPNVDWPRFADALTGGMVNMLVINKHCVVPKPFGPVVGGVDLFEADLLANLTPLGLTVHFLDDWYEYHVGQGEVHCGTNTLRKTAPIKWWEYRP